MPTFEQARRFQRDLAKLTKEQRAAFKRAVRRFVTDLRSGSFRAGLRVKGIEGADGIFEMSWAADGRATFEYGAERRAGEPHIRWRRVGSHDIFGSP